ncbi:hypothetical protein GPECTOR_68g393 [Gonium pectorale]|uniref:Protein kinase domain-containing protein n=1 Tax=Gonium pectorale TaxID=33097 RepID=A0A150G534_GONPE|nr:hypothetical protein GPECTOR_68g393 [Gonium pectorale]|eukprot:KXZ44420.1 hypothetical protein GPECTOR_68g393 [Gonium pectorale]
MEGGSLAGLMVKQLLAGSAPKYSFSQALGWILDVSRALQYLHTGGRDGFPRIHRDVKLENVLLTEGLREAKLADFGLQRAILSRKAEQDQTILVRRCQRQPASISGAAPQLPMRSGPAGPSRLAPDAAQRTASTSVQRRRLSGMQLALTGPDEQSLHSTHGASPHATGTGAATDGGGQQFKHSGEGQVPWDQVQPSPAGTGTGMGMGTGTGTGMGMGTGTGTGMGTGTGTGTGTVFFAVEQDGLLPLELPEPPPLTAETPDGAPVLAMGAVERLQEALQVARSAASIAALGRPLIEEPEDDEDDADGEGGGAVCPFSGYGGSKSQQLPRQPAGVMPGQVYSTGGVVVPSAVGLRGQQGSSRRSGPLALRIPGTSTASPRPSPLGTPSSRGAGGAGGAGAVPPVGITGTGGASPAVLSPSASAARSTRASPQVTATGALPAPALVNAPVRQGTSLLGDAGSPAGSRPGSAPSDPNGASPRGVPTPFSLSGEGGPSGQQLPAAPGPSQPDDRPSAVSAREVLMLSGSPRGGGPGGGAQDGGRSSASQASGAAASLAARPPSALRAGSAQAALGSKSGSSAGGAASSARPRVHIVDSRDDGGKDEGGDGAALVSKDSARQLLPGAAKHVDSREASGELEAHLQPEPVSMSAGGLRGPAASVPLNSGGESLSLPVGGINHISSYNEPAGSGGTAAGGPAPAQQLADLLHMRLGALNVSVRSVRASGSGAVPGGARVSGIGGGTTAMGSAPTSPRRAAVQAAARAAGAAGAAPGPGRSNKSMSCSGASAALKKAAAADYEEVFSLTGRTGSLIYLAPEAYKNEPYNDKVDVYSLAILMYELFGRTSITYTHISTKLPAFSRMLCNPDEFAERVAAGYRPPRPNQMNKLPPELWELIEAAWHQDPVQRPDIDTIVEALEGMVDTVAEMELGRKAAAGCGCAIS